jgi:hypothetical protein
MQTSVNQLMNTEIDIRELFRIRSQIRAKPTVLVPDSYPEYEIIYWNGVRPGGVVLEIQELNERFVKDMYASLLNTEEPTKTGKGPFGKNPTGYARGLQRLRTVMESTFGHVLTVNEMNEFNPGQLTGALARFLLDVFLEIYEPIVRAIDSGVGGVISSAEELETQKKFFVGVIQKYTFYENKRMRVLSAPIQPVKMPALEISRRGPAKMESPIKRQDSMVPTGEPSQIRRQNSTDSRGSARSTPGRTSGGRGRRPEPPIVYSFGTTHVNTPLDPDAVILRTSKSTAIVPVQTAVADVAVTVLEMTLAKTADYAVKYEDKDHWRLVADRSDIDTNVYHRCELHSGAGRKNFPRLTPEQFRKFDGTYGSVTPRLVTYDICYLLKSPPVNATEYEVIKQGTENFTNLIADTNKDVDEYYQFLAANQITGKRVTEAYEVFQKSRHRAQEYVDSATIPKLQGLFKNNVFALVAQVSQGKKKTITNMVLGKPNVIDYELMSTFFGIEDEVFAAETVRRLDVLVGSVFGDYVPENDVSVFSPHIVTSLPDSITNSLEPGFYRFRITATKDGQNAFTLMTADEGRSILAMIQNDRARELSAIMDYENNSAELGDLTERLRTLEDMVQEANEIAHEDDREFQETIELTQNEITIVRARIQELTVPVVRPEATDAEIAALNAVIDRVQKAIPGSVLELSITSDDGLSVPEPIEINELVYRDIVQGIERLYVVGSYGHFTVEVRENTIIRGLNSDRFESYDDVCDAVGSAYLKSKGLGLLQDSEFRVRVRGAKRVEPVTITSRLSVIPRSLAMRVGGALLSKDSRVFTSVVADATVELAKTVDYAKYSCYRIRNGRRELDPQRLGIINAIENTPLGGSYAAGDITRRGMLNKIPESVVLSYPRINERMILVKNIDVTMTAARYEMVRKEGERLYVECFRGYDYEHGNQDRDSRELKQELYYAGLVIRDRIRVLNNLSSIQNDIGEYADVNTRSEFIQAAADYLLAYDSGGTVQSSGRPTGVIPFYSEVPVTVKPRDNFIPEVVVHDPRVRDFLDFMGAELTITLSEAMLDFPATATALSPESAETKVGEGKTDRRVNRRDVITLSVLCRVIVKTVSEDDPNSTFPEFYSDFIQELVQTKGMMNKQVQRIINTYFPGKDLSTIVKEAASAVRISRSALEFIQQNDFIRAVYDRYDAYVENFELTMASISTVHYTARRSDLTNENIVRESSVNLENVNLEHPTGELITDAGAKLATFKTSLIRGKTFIMNKTNEYSIDVYERSRLYEDVLQYAGDLPIVDVYELLGLYLLNNNRELLESIYNQYYIDRNYKRSQKVTNNYDELFAKGSREDLIKNQDELYKFRLVLTDVYSDYNATEGAYNTIRAQFKKEQDSLDEKKTNVITKFVNVSAIADSIVRAYTNAKSQPEFRDRIARLSAELRVHIQKFRNLKLSTMNVVLELSEINDRFYAARRTMFLSMTPVTVNDFGTDFARAAGRLRTRFALMDKKITDHVVVFEMVMGTIANEATDLSPNIVFTRPFSQNVRYVSGGDVESLRRLYIERGLLTFLMDEFGGFWESEMDAYMYPILLPDRITRTRDMTEFDRRVNEIIVPVSEVRMSSKFSVEYETTRETIREFTQYVIDSVSIMDQGPGFHFLAKILYTVSILNDDNIGLVKDYRRRLAAFVPDLEQITSLGKFDAFVRTVSGTFDTAEYAYLRERSKIDDLPYDVYAEVTPSLMRSVFLIVQRIGDDSTVDSIARDLQEFGVSVEDVNTVSVCLARFLDEYVVRRIGDGDVVLNDDLILELRSTYRLRTRGTCYIPVYNLMRRILEAEVNSENGRLTWSIILDYMNYVKSAGDAFTQYSGVEGFILNR